MKRLSVHFVLFLAMYNGQSCTGVSNHCMYNVNGREISVIGYTDDDGKEYTLILNEKYDDIRPLDQYSYLKFKESWRDYWECVITYENNDFIVYSDYGGIDLVKGGDANIFLRRVGSFKLDSIHQNNPRALRIDCFYREKPSQ